MSNFREGDKGEQTHSRSGRDQAGEQVDREDSRILTGCRIEGLRVFAVGGAADDKLRCFGDA